jgi:hypothetical protein
LPTGAHRLLNALAVTVRYDESKDAKLLAEHRVHRRSILGGLTHEH